MEPERKVEEGAGEKEVAVEGEAEQSWEVSASEEVEEVKA